jgi:hypothetical protein
LQFLNPHLQKLNFAKFAPLVTKDLDSILEIIETSEEVTLVIKIES